MRISDWSSDVCSSDLIRRREPGELSFMVPRSVALFCAAALGASVVSAGLVWALMAMLAGAGIDFFLSWLTTVLLGMLIVTPPIVMLARMRSEEHTSELQSLMRISYAVFCLKKKNKKQYR